MANPVLDRLLIQYHSLGIAPFIRQTYQTGIPHLQCATLFHIPIAGDVSHGVLYSSGIGLEHFECGHHDPIDDDLLCLLCKEIKQSQGDTSRPRLPITNNVLKA